MIELTPADAAVILRQANTQGIGLLPSAELNEEGQTEIVRWIEYVGRSDDQLSPYAWFSLAEEAASSHDPDEPIMIEMLSSYTLSGESEMLELCRMSHFDWSIEAIPVEFIQNADDLLDAGVPLRLLLLAEAAGNTFSKRMIEMCPDMTAHRAQLLARAIHAFFLQLCRNAGIALDKSYLLSTDDGTFFQLIDKAQFDAAIENCLESARSVLQSLDPDLNASLSAIPTLFDRQ